MTQTQTSTWRTTLVDYAQVPPLAQAMRCVDPVEADALLRSMTTRPASQYPGRDRRQLADGLAAYNASVGNPLGDSTLEAIRGQGVFVIAGQQPGLLLGPMYTLLKAAAAVGQARRLADEVDVPVIPAFWIAGEDHDLAEVSRCHVDGKKFVVPHVQAAGIHPPVAQVSLEPWRGPLIEFLRQSLGDLPHAAWVIDLVSSVRFDNYAVMFAELTSKLLGRHGLVLIDPMTLRDLAAPVLATMADRWTDLQAAFDRGTATVRGDGFDPPLERINLFAIDEKGRHAVDVTADEVLRNPRGFSPSAGLRPIVQDAVLPTLTTLGGPSELLYLRQIVPLYDVLGVSPSRRYPRMTATFIDAAAARRAEKAHLPGPAIFRVLDQLQQPPSGGAGDHADLAGIESLGRELLERVNHLSDPHNEKIVAKASESIRYQVAKVIERVSQQRLEAEGAGRRQLQAIADLVYPGGKLQERVTSPMEMLARFGPEFIDGLVTRLDPFVIAHQLVTIDTGPQGVQP